MPQSLHFVPDSSLCLGYYQENSIFPLTTPQKISLSAKEATFSQNEPSRLKGEVIVQRGMQKIEAPFAKIHTDLKTKKIEAIEFPDGLLLQEPGKWIQGQRAYFPIKGDKVQIENILYRIHLENDERKTPLDSHHLKLLGLVAWGHGKRLEQLTSQHIRILDTTFTTCSPALTADWHFSAKRIDLDIQKKRGYAHHTLFWIKKVPIFYTPYLSFPLNQERQSGFLTPTPGLNYEFSLPYYFNLAPNYDYTLTPHFYGKHGLMLESEFRYLNQKNNGKLYVSILPYDKTFQSQTARQYDFKHTRNAIRLKHKTQWTDTWSLDLNYNRVSDDQYFHNFFNTLKSGPSNHLLQQADLKYQTLHWSFLTRLQAYQTLNPKAFIPADPIYRQLPAIHLNLNYPNPHTPFDLEWDNQWVHLQWPNTTPLANNPWHNIHRLHSQPKFTWKLLDANTLFLKSILKLDTTHYTLYQNSQKNETQLRLIPIFSLGSGFKFQTLSAKSPWLSSIEPQLKYVYIPFKKQSFLPMVDSQYHLFNFEQLLQENRFSGIDRVGDTHHLSLLFSTHVSHTQTNHIPLRFGLGQTVYFNPRRVGLCTGTHCHETKFMGYTSPQEPLSPLASFVTWSPHRTTTIKTDASWHWRLKKPYLVQTNLQWKQNPQQVFNFGYSFIKNGDTLVPSLVPTTQTLDLSQWNTSFYAPLNARWSTYGSLSINTISNHFQTHFAGLEYNDCCWTSRFLVGRTFIATNNQGKTVYNSMIYIQIALKGLGSHHGDPIQNLLTTHIRDFKDTH